MRRIGLFALALLLLEGPRAVAAQAAQPRAHASLEASLAGSSVLESTVGFLGMAGLLSLDGRFSFGAGGSLMLGPTTVESDGAGSDLDLRLAYGGVLLQLKLVGSTDRYLALRALVGAGNAKIEDTVYGLEIGADNFGVVEPEVVGMIPLAGPLGLGLGVGYRGVFGVDDVPGVGPSDLAGPSAKVRVSIRTN
ncbi:MAG TPA: hypothetical protein VLA36_02960 [Longimicrobiales bacterium]|nr:hypothetical protein [Longimicrobiales bacterium]